MLENPEKFKFNDAIFYGPYSLAKDKGIPCVYKGCYTIKKWNYPHDSLNIRFYREVYVEISNTIMKVDENNLSK